MDYNYYFPMGSGRKHFLLNVFVYNWTVHKIDFRQNVTNIGRVIKVVPKESIPKGTIKVVIEPEKIFGQYVIKNKAYFKIAGGAPVGSPIYRTYPMFMVDTQVNDKYFIVNTAFITGAGKDDDPYRYWKIVYDKYVGDGFLNVYVNVFDRKYIKE